jgi:ribosomal protein S12 methylthiotransferase accessory factor
VPVFLWAPWYPGHDQAGWRRDVGDHTDYGRVKSYSVNTGCAIGATEDEAVLHALNECVERDAFSLFLLRCVHDGATPPRRIARHVLPADAAALLADADAIVGHTVELFDLTTDFGVPVVLVFDRRDGAGPRGRYGLGASLLPRHALRRAVGELVQTALIARQLDNTAADALIHRALGRHPRLLAAATMRLPDTAVDTPATARRFGTNGAPDPAANTAPGGAVDAHPGLAAAPVAAQRRAVTERLLAAGHDVLVRPLVTLAHGTTVVQVQCPGLERFHLVVEGHVALPGARARRLRRAG